MRRRQEKAGLLACFLFDRDLHLSVGPAALKPTAAFSRIVVGSKMKNVLARLAERHSAGRFSAEGSSLVFYFVDGRLGLRKRHIAGTAILRPAQDDRRTQVLGAI